MQKLQELSFRQLDKAFVFISIADVGFLNDYFDNANIANGIVAYAFIDHEEGICFEIICCASFDTASKSLKLHACNDGISINLPYENLADEYVLVLNRDILPDTLASKISNVEMLSQVSEELAQTRTITAIDCCRTVGKPDEVLVYLVQGNDYFETVYVRLEKVGKMNLTGTLLQEPKKDLAVHCGDVIDFFIVKNNHGIMCMATFK